MFRILATASLCLLSAVTPAQSVCKPAVRITGTTCIGDTVTLTLGGHLDCRGCLVGSIAPGPTQVGRFSVPVGMPANIFVIGVAGSTRTLRIPNDPVLMNASYYFAAALTDGVSMSVSAGRKITICP